MTVRPVVVLTVSSGVSSVIDGDSNNVDVDSDSVDVDGHEIDGAKDVGGNESY